MQIENILGNRLMGRTMKALQNALDFGEANQSVIAGNLANIETPGYAPLKATFNQALRQAVANRNNTPVMEVSLNRTDERHLPPSRGPERAYSIEKMGENMGSFSLDREMAHMAKNNLLYEASVKLLAKKFESLRNVIEAGRR
jgi:flagellar basal-body rod protein FlgB